MTAFQFSPALANSLTLEGVVAIINEGTCEGMEGMEFTGEQLAGQYAYQASKESGYPVDAGSIEGHLEFLAEAGATFDTTAAAAHGMALSKSFVEQYTVDADRETGEWIDEPKFVATVLRADWNAKQDTEDCHFDTYEVDDQTRAIEVVWVTTKTGGNYSELGLYLVSEGEVNEATEEAEWDGVNSILVAATSAEGAMKVAAAYDAGNVIADNLAWNGKTIAVVTLRNPETGLYA